MAGIKVSAVTIIMMVMAGLTGVLIGGIVVYLATERSVIDKAEITVSPALRAALPTTETGAFSTWNWSWRNRTKPIPGVQVFDTTKRRDVEVRTVEINTAITDVVERVSPAVVTVVNMTAGGSPQGSGSGVIISAQGHVLTNYHVVEEAGYLEIVFADGELGPAQLVGRDVYSDIALLKVLAEVPGVAQLGNSDVLRPGETVIAIGSPLGEFRNTVTVGVVSAIGRILDTDRGYQLEDMLQTDAAINHGNSGGPLVNLAGQVVGLNTMIVRSDGTGTKGAEGLGFAVASNTVRAVSDQLSEQGFVTRPFLGIRWEPVTPYESAIRNLPVEWGVSVTDIVDGSSAAEAGLEPGDIIVALDDLLLDETHPFINALLTYEPGETVLIGVVRGSEPLWRVEVVLGENR